MSSKKKSKAGRKISAVKRGNQKRNKLIKKGKLKPKSQSPYLATHQQAKKKDPSGKKLGQQPTQDENESEEEEEEEEDPEDRMHWEDALRLNTSILEKGEQKALERYQARNEETEKKQGQGLLPLKTKSGIIFQKQPNEDEEDEQAEEDDEMDEEEEEEEEPAKVPYAPATTSVLQLLSTREDLVRRLRMDVGSMASNFLERPDERLYLLEDLLKRLSTGTPGIEMTAFKLISATLTELFKDVIPNYTIAHHNTEQVMKKDTLRLQKYENQVLKYSKTFLMTLEKGLKSGNKAMQGHILSCVDILLVAHPQFNYAPNMIHLLIPYLNAKEPAIRSKVQATLESVFRDDRKGLISLQIVKQIKKVVDSKKKFLHQNLIEVFLALRLQSVSKSDEGDEGKKSGHVPGGYAAAKKMKKKEAAEKAAMSKKERKRKKALEKVEREMLEAKGEESQHEKNKNFTDCTTILFAMLFKTVKDDSRSKVLLKPCLKCISKFCHHINIDFFNDLLKVLCAHVDDHYLHTEQRLQCIKTAFDILSGPGSLLTFDASKLTESFKKIVLASNLNMSDSAVETICSVAQIITVKRKKSISGEQILSLVKALLVMSMQTSSRENCVQILETIKRIRAAHFQLVESAKSGGEEEIPQIIGGDSMELRNLGNTLWGYNSLADRCKAVISLD